MNAPKVRATRLETSIGPAYQAQCECGWTGRKYYTKGARDVARSERWSHELDHEDGLIDASPLVPSSVDTAVH